MTVRSVTAARLYDWAVNRCSKAELLSPNSLLLLENVDSHNVVEIIKETLFLLQITISLCLLFAFYCTK